MGDLLVPHGHVDRPQAPEYLNTITADDENDEMAAAWTAIRSLQLHDRTVLHLYECTNEMVLSTKKPVADGVEDQPFGRGLTGECPSNRHP
jgi:hypothetical protein